MTIAGGRPSRYSITPATAGWTSNFNTLRTATEARSSPTLRCDSDMPSANRAVGAAAPPRKLLKVPAAPGNPMPLADKATPTRIATENGLRMAPVRARRTEAAGVPPPADSMIMIDKGIMIIKSIINAAAERRTPSGPNVAPTMGIARKPIFAMAEPWPNSAISLREALNNTLESSIPSANNISVPASQAPRNRQSRMALISWRAKAPMTRAGMAK